MDKFPSLIEFVDRELEAKTGVFLNPKTGTVWELCIQEEKLILKMPNFSFKISPSSPDRFKPVDTLINLEIEFEKPNAHNSLRMHVYAKTIKRATFFLS